MPAHATATRASRNPRTRRTRLPTPSKPLQPTLHPHPFVEGHGALVQGDGLTDVTCCFVFLASKTSHAGSNTRCTLMDRSRGDAQHRESIGVGEVRDGTRPHCGAELFDGGSNFFARSAFQLRESNRHVAGITAVVPSRCHHV